MLSTLNNKNKIIKNYLGSNILLVFFIILFLLFFLTQKTELNMFFYLFFLPASFFMIFGFYVLFLNSGKSKFIPLYLTNEKEDLRYRETKYISKNIFQKSRKIGQKEKIYGLRYTFLVHRSRSLDLEKNIQEKIKEFSQSIFVHKVYVSHNSSKFPDYCHYLVILFFKTPGYREYFLCKYEKELEKVKWISSYFKKKKFFAFIDFKKDFSSYTNNCRVCQSYNRNKIKELKKNFLNFQSILIFLFLIVYTIFFYSVFFIKDILNLHQFWRHIVLIFLLVVSTDGLILFINAFRSERKNLLQNREKFDPSLVTCVIACYNGEKVIAETLRQVMLHIPKNQIIVVSDKSTDNTAKIVREMGIKVIENKINLNKALSISKAVNEVKTPLVLLMDDDVYIKDIFIPTSLITERGYRAVAFNVLPKKTNSLINALQIFEYRKSMFFSKALRSKMGAVANVSGAIGLFLREDIDIQKTVHSGQFGGEDQQRTTLVHLLRKISKNNRKGVTFYNSTIYTDVPDTWKAFFRQRSFSWGMATHENFWLFLKTIVSPQTNFLLKIDRAYLLFIFLTEPLRMFLFPFLFLFPFDLFLLITVYFVLENIAWLRLKRKDPYWVVLFSPFFSLFKTITRFIAYFYWFKVKYVYFRKNMHSYIISRKLLYEYATVSFVVFLLFFIISVLYIK